MLDIILSPLAAFKRLKTLQERWSAALMAPVACAILLLAGTLAFTRNAMPVIGEAISPFVSGDRDSLFWLVATQVILLGTSYLLIAGLAVVVVVSLDTLIRPDENGRGKLAELVGLSFYSQVPYALVVLVVGFSRPSVMRARAQVRRRPFSSGSKSWSAELRAAARERGRAP